MLRVTIGSMALYDFASGVLSESSVPKECYSFEPEDPRAADHVLVFKVTRVDIVETEIKQAYERVRSNNK